MRLTNYRKSIFISLLVLLVSISNITAIAQSASPAKTEKDKKKNPHSPHKATIYSMVLPGLGQAYNKKYWKIPLVYGGFGVLGYFIVSNKKEYLLYKEAFEFVPSDDNPTPPNNYYNRYTKDQLKNGRDYYRRNLELSYILSGVWYLLNIIDASVDAHLFQFDISDNLSLNIQAEGYLDRGIYDLPISKPITGLTLRFKLP